jgi:hypothetical protein
VKTTHLTVSSHVPGRRRVRKTIAITDLYRSERVTLTIGGEELEFDRGRLQAALVQPVRDGERDL